MRSYFTSWSWAICIVLLERAPGRGGGLRWVKREVRKMWAFSKKGGRNQTCKKVASTSSHKSVLPNGRKPAAAGEGDAGERFGFLYSSNANG